MNERKTWAKVQIDLHNDRKVQEIACKHGSRAIAYWLVFILESKRKHRSNEGWSGAWTLTQFAAACYDEKSTKKKVRELIEDFVAAGLLEVDGELVRRWYARPTRFLRIQQTADDTERKRNYRQSLQGKHVSSPENVTALSQENPIENEREKEKENKNIKSKVHLDHSVASIATANRAALVSDQINQVFEYWVKVETETGGLERGRKLTNDRKQKIKARLAEGFSVDDLTKCIDGYCNDKWYQGENDRNTRYTDLTTIFKSGSAVEKGLGLVGQSGWGRLKAVPKPRANGLPAIPDLSGY